MVRLGYKNLLKAKILENSKYYNVMLKSECVGSKSFWRAGGFQFNAFNQMEGASNQTVNW